MLWKHAGEPPALGELSHESYWGCYCRHSSSSLRFRAEKNEAWRRQEKQQVKRNNSNKNSVKQLIREDSTRTVYAVTNHIRTWEKFLLEFSTKKKSLYRWILCHLWYENENAVTKRDSFFVSDAKDYGVTTICFSRAPAASHRSIRVNLIPNGLILTLYSNL